MISDAHSTPRARIRSQRDAPPPPAQAPAAALSTSRSLSSTSRACGSTAAGACRVRRGQAARSRAKARRAPTGGGITTAALKKARGRRIEQDLAARGIEVMARGYRTLGEEMSEAYKDVEDVVDVIEGAGVSRKVAKLVPLGVIKG